MRFPFRRGGVFTAGPAAWPGTSPSGPAGGLAAVEEAPWPAPGEGQRRGASSVLPLKSYLAENRLSLTRGWSSSSRRCKLPSPAALRGLRDESRERRPAGGAPASGCSPAAAAVTRGAV